MVGWNSLSGISFHGFPFGDFRFADLASSIYLCLCLANILVSFLYTYTIVITITVIFVTLVQKYKLILN